MPPRFPRLPPLHTLPRNSVFSPVQVVSRDIFRRIVVRGYGSVAVPTIAGHTVKLVRTFAPLTSSIFQQISAYFKGTAPQVLLLCLQT